ncbi:response regulator transcription factor [Paenibacillus alginolyticus]|uniref:Response regulator n=1 Tax=Paenibacillus alginolyticus TaxID=59839 RepID=A0ABT4GPM8_9BACL|nr:response regulator [Paenibacillus alginolyticus]MCY9698180.1 response regulator [Paenibacillus alginolyticus]MEC0146726.1 response regulator [Paenibacillus alginolyticus]
MYTVLLIEDEDQIRFGLKRLIEDVIGGFRVVKEAKNGREALDWMKVEIPDLIITDIRMREMNGLEMIEKVRDRPQDIFILVISGYNDFEYTKRSIQLRVENYLLEPVDRIELTQCLTTLKERLNSRNRKRNEQPKAKGSVEENEKKIIRQVKDIVHSNLDQDISLQFVANKVHMNRQYLSYLFKLETGQNFVDYVIQSRMDRAQQLLLETQLKIYEIAQLSGYENPKYFMTVFKQLVGVTPSDFRKKQHEC